jgi:phosphoribosylanthranilate isomerase
VPFDWSLVKGLAERVPFLILAGGLCPSNVAAAIRAVRPHAVDVSSGVEAAPGRKDPEKVRAFVEAARSATGVPARGARP